MSRMRRCMRMRIYGSSQLRMRMRMHWGLLIFLLALLFPVDCRSVQLLFDALCRWRLTAILNWRPSWQPSWISGPRLAAILDLHSHLGFAQPSWISGSRLATILDWRLSWQPSWRPSWIGGLLGLVAFLDWWPSWIGGHLDVLLGSRVYLKVRC